MKFVLVALSGKPVAEGILADAFAGRPLVLTWRGETFVHFHRLEDPNRRFEDDEVLVFAECLGQALEYFQATPIRTEPTTWSSPTALGQRAARPLVPSPAGPTTEWREKPEPPPHQVEQRGVKLPGVPVANPVAPPMRRRGQP